MNSEGLSDKLKESKILVIIPAYNEERNITYVIKEVKEKAPYVDILVVNDGSRDSTSKLAHNSGVRVADLPSNKGIGVAVQAGYKIACHENYDIAIQIDGDRQHDPSNIPMLCEPISNGKADVVIGSRFKEKNSYKTSVVRMAGIKFFSWLTSKIIKQKITDVCSIRAINKHAISICSKEYPPEFPDAESLILLAYRNLRITEVPMRVRQRKEGSSFFSTLRFMRYPFKNLFSIIRLVLREKGGKTN